MYSTTRNCACILLLGSVYYQVCVCVMSNSNPAMNIFAENCPENVLKWSDRLAILIGVAKAVHFLHTGVIPGCFNNRLKTNNILLDEHRIAKLSDYGMSIITEESEKLEACFLTYIKF